MTSTSFYCSWAAVCLAATLASCTQPIEAADPAEAREASAESALTEAEAEAAPVEAVAPTGVAPAAAGDRTPPVFDWEAGGEPEGDEAEPQPSDGHTASSENFRATFQVGAPSSTQVEAGNEQYRVTGTIGVPVQTPGQTTEVQEQ